MRSELLNRAATLNRRNSVKRIWYRIMVALAAVVVFVTTYALILPAITQTNDVVAEVTTGPQLRQAINDNDAGTIKLMADFTMDGNDITVGETKNLTIDLNGHTLTKTCLFGVSGGSLTIDDSAEPTDTVTLVPKNDAAAVYDSVNNVLTYYVPSAENEAMSEKHVVELCGRIVQTGNKQRANYVEAGGTLTVQDGTLCNTNPACNAVITVTKGTAEIVNGYIVSTVPSGTSNYSGNGGLVDVDGASSVLNIHGGVLAGGQAVRGGAVYLVHEATLNMTGGVIAGNIATANEGSAIYGGGATHVTITGGTIANNVGGKVIAGINKANVTAPEELTTATGQNYVEVATVTELMKALSMEKDVYIRMTDDMRVMVKNPGNLALKKAVEVSSTGGGNVKAGAVDGVIDNSHRWAMLTGSTDQQYITVDLGETYDLSQMKVYWENVPASYTVQFSDDNVTWTDAVLQTVPDTTTMSTFDENGTTKYITEQTLTGTARYVKLIMEPNGQYLSIQELEIYGSDYDPSLTWNLVGNKTLDLNGHTLTQGDDGTDKPLFEVGVGDTLTICDSVPRVETRVDITPEVGLDDALDYVNANGDNGVGLEYLKDDGFLKDDHRHVMENRQAVLNDDGTITYYVLETALKPGFEDVGDTEEHLYECTVTEYGMITADKSEKTRPLKVSGGTLNINGGVIGFCQGGAAWITGGDGGNVNVNDGLICGNYVSGDGAVLHTYYASGDVNVTINGGIVSGNYCTGGGGAFCFASLTDVTMRGGLVTANHASYDGGAFRLGYGTKMLLTEKGCITGNYGGGIGGGVAVLEGCSFTVNGEKAFITGNALLTLRANDICHEGGGVAVAGGALGYFYQGYITNNMTTTREHWGGGGVFIAEGGNGFALDTLMTNNTAGGFGGGIGACSTGHLYIEGDEGLASFDNEAGIFGKDAATIQGHLAGGASSKHSDTDYGFNNPIFMANGRDDVYSALSCTINGRMLGGGSADWQGSVDGRAVMFGGDETMVSTSTIGLTSNASEAARDMAKKTAKMFFNGNNSNHHAGAMLVNGQFIAGTSTNIDIGVLLTLGVTKNLYDVSKTEITDLSGYEFTFSVYDEKGNVVSIGTAQPDGSVVFDRRLTFDQAGVYWFYLVENPVSDRYSNIVRDQKVYCFRVECVVDEEQSKQLDETHWQTAYTFTNPVPGELNGYKFMENDVPIWYRADGVMAPGVMPILSDGMTKGDTDANGWTYNGTNRASGFLLHTYERHMNIGGDSTFNNYMVEDTFVTVEKQWGDERGHSTDTVEMVLQQSTDGGMTWSDVATANLGKVNLLQAHLSNDADAVTAISQFGADMGPKYSLDGDYTTKWQAHSDHKNDNWIQYKLDDVYEIGELAITWGKYNSVGTTTIDTGVMNEETGEVVWTTVATGLGGVASGTTERVTLDKPVSAQYIRITNKDNNSGKMNCAADILEVEAYVPFSEGAWTYTWDHLPVFVKDAEGNDTTTPLTYRVVEKSITEHGTTLVETTDLAGTTDGFIIVSDDLSKQLVFSEDGTSILAKSVEPSGEEIVGGVTYEQTFHTADIDIKAVFRCNIVERYKVLYSLAMGKRLIVNGTSLQVIGTYGKDGYDDVSIDENGLYFRAWNGEDRDDSIKWYLIYDETIGNFTVTTDAALAEEKGVRIFKCIDRVMDTDGEVDAGKEPSSYVTSVTQSEKATDDVIYVPQTSLKYNTDYIITSPDGTKVLSLYYQGKDQNGDGVFDASDVNADGKYEIDNSQPNHRDGDLNELDVQSATRRNKVISRLQADYDNFYLAEEIRRLGSHAYFRLYDNGIGGIRGGLFNPMPANWETDSNGCLRVDLNTGKLGTTWNLWTLQAKFDDYGHLYLQETPAESKEAFYIVFDTDRFATITPAQILKQSSEFSELHRLIEEQVAYEVANGLIDVDLAANIAELEAVITALYDEKATLERELSALQTQLTDLQRELTVLQSEQSDLQTQKESLEADIAALNVTLADLQSQLEALDTTAEDYETQKAALETEIGEVSTAIPAKEEELATVQTNLTAKSEAITAKQDEITAKNTDISNKEDEIAAKQAEIDPKVEELAGWNNYAAQLSLLEDAVLAEVSALQVKFGDGQGMDVEGSEDKEIYDYAYDYHRLLQLQSAASPNQTLINNYKHMLRMDIQVFGQEILDTYLDVYGALVYGPNSSLSGDYGYTVTNTPKKYQTYSMEITKVNEENTDVLVPNVTFRLLDADGNHLTFDFDGAFYHYNAEGTGTTSNLVTDAYGKIYADGLPAGTFTLREIDCPFGYKLVGDRKVEFSSNPTESFTIADPYSTTDLPATGGVGTQWFYLLGILLLVGAPILYLCVRKCQSKKKTCW